MHFHSSFPIEVPLPPPPMHKQDLHQENNLDTTSQKDRNVLPTSASTQSTQRIKQITLSDLSTPVQFPAITMDATEITENDLTMFLQRLV